MAEGPHTPLAQVFAVFSDHTQEHWEPEFASYLYWKFVCVSAYRDGNIRGIFQRAYVDYKRDRGLGRFVGYRDITAAEFAYIHSRRLELQGIRPRQRRRPRRRRTN